MARKNIKPLDQNEIVQKYLGGLSTCQIARELETTATRIIHILEIKNSSRPTNWKSLSLAVTQ